MKKRCTKCKKIKPIDHFWSEKRTSKHGFEVNYRRNSCNVCSRKSHEKSEIKYKELNKVYNRLKLKEKKCSACKETRDISKFGINKRSRDGFRSDCKDCQRYNRQMKKGYCSLIPPQYVLPEGLKKCCGCKQVKSVNEFYAHKNSWDKLCSNCKECGREGRRKRTEKLTYGIVANYLGMSLKDAPKDLLDLKRTFMIARRELRKYRDRRGELP